ncbi:uncharacterized protein LOC117562850 isoform X6 [Gymnodraco acuticeps]|uniref:Uncharacterized protein LOC117562850 isoform X6 n=1 Tax=Gymnodraco acuticeps TaxID=8218 RepID=A0A6P8VZD3_GYMAC|nr:uncharacterized protein LOC117562850 isoform X6 [Gymnodraco acuticeps]
MDHLNLGCQVCLTTSNYMLDLKTHIHSHGHVQKMIEVFQQDMFKGHGIFPFIELIKSRVRREITWPIIGLSLCFSRKSKTYFYMCHVCEEKFLSMRILSHITSMDHHRNNFSYINPNALSFSWMPENPNKYFLRSELREGGNDEESTIGDLQLLELPGELFKQVEKSNYSEVARTLSEIEKLPKMHEVFKKERMTIQTYLKDSKREHPLLGMQHLIECICVGQTEKRYYLCTLCNITLTPQGIIKHVLSFDHIFSYFKAWHPSTLSLNAYFNTYTKDFGSLMLNFAKQAEEIHGTANMDIKQVILEPAKFASVDFTSYTEALKELESITKENNGSSLMTIVKPGKKLVLKALESTPKEKDDCSSMTIVNQEKMPASKELESITKENDESSVMKVVNQEKMPASKELESITKENDESSVMKVVNQEKMPASKELESITKENDESSVMKVVNQEKMPASKELESITKENDESSVMKVVNQEKMPASKELESITKENDESSVMKVVNPEKKPEEPIKSYQLHCQNCGWSFNLFSKYCKHVSSWKHQEMVNTFVGGGWVPELGLYYIHKESLKLKQPLIGISLIMTFVCNQVESKPFYICFACEECFSESSLRQHLHSTQHLVYTLVSFESFIWLLYQNPWRLTFAWETCLDLSFLRSMAWEEEKERGTNERKLKVFDIPYWIFEGLDQLNYIQVMERLGLYHTVLRNNVPERETYSKLKQNEIFPQLGSHFLVIYPSCTKELSLTKKGYVCLLCERRLFGDECYAHVFSFDHVETFLESFHPGSTDSSTDAETLLDLAKQAGRIHPISCVQVICMERPIWDSYSYSTTLKLLAGRMWTVCQAALTAPIIPGKKLIPRETLKAVATKQVTDSSQKNGRMMGCCENTTSQKSTDQSETTLKTIPVEVGAEVTNTQFAKSGQSVEKGNKDIPTPSEKESQKRKEFSRDGLAEIKTDGSETCQKPSRESPVTCKKTDKKDEMERVKKRNKSGKEILKQKRIISQEDPCPVQDMKQVKKQTKGILSSKKDSSESQMQVTDTDRGESGKPGQEPAKDESSSNVNCQQKNQLWQFLKKKTRHPVIGLSGLVELQCDERDPIYLCDCCSLTIPEKDIISHVSGIDHQKLYLMKFQKLPPLREMQQVKAIRDVAALFEQQNGYGEAQVEYLEKEIYDEILVQNFKSAIKTVKKLQDQMNIRRYERSYTSAPSSVQPVDTSTAQHQLGSMKNDYQEVNMEVDEDSEDSCLTVSKSSVHKAEILSNKMFVPFQIAAISQKEGTCKTAPTSCFNETTPKTSMPAKSTAASSISTMGETANGRRATPSISTATTSEPAATTTTSTASISSEMSTTKSATLPKPLENITGAAANITAKTSYKAATASNKESMVVHEAAFKTAPASKKENTSRNSENVSTALFLSQTHPVTSVADIKMAVKCDNTEASVKTAAMKNSVASTADVAPNVQKSKAPKDPKLNRHTNPTTEPSRNSTTPKVVGILKALLRTRDVHVSSPSTHTAEVLRQNVTYTSPASRQDDCIYMPQNEGLSPVNQSEQIKHQLQTRLVQIPAVNIGKHQDYQPPLATGAAGRFTDSPDTCQETRNTKQQQARRDPELEDSSREQQNQPKSSQRAEHVSTHSQALTMFLTGESSHLSTYLKVQGTERGGSIIGQGFVWECQGISVSPFYLCESCKEMIIHYKICEHMRSYDHQLQYIWMQYPDLLNFWDRDFILEEMKREIVEGIAMMLSKRECYYKVDAQCTLLRPGAFEHVKSLSFSEALKLVKDLKDPKLDWQTSFTAQHKETRQEIEEYHSENTVGYLDGVQQRRVLSPLNVKSSSPNADFLVPPISSLSPQVKPGPPDFQHQMPITEYQVKQAEVHLESQSSAIVGPKTIQTLSLSPTVKCPPTRKRPADEPTLDRYSTSNPQLEDPLPKYYKPTCSQPSSESASESSLVNPAATPPLLSPLDQDAGPESFELDKLPEYTMHFDHLLALVRKTKLNVSSGKSPPSNNENATSCTYDSSQRVVKSSWDQKHVQIMSNMPPKETTGDLKHVNVTQDPAAAYSFEEMSLTSAAPVGHEKQLVAPHANWALSANNSSLMGSTSTRGNLLFRGTEAQTVSTVLASASTVDPSDPQHQISVKDQRNPSLFCEVPNDNPETVRPNQLPINTIITARPNDLFMSGYNREALTEMNQGGRAAHTLAAAAPMRPSKASGGLYVLNGQQVFISPDAVGSYTTPDHIPAYTTRGVFPKQEAGPFSMQSFGHISASPLPPDWVMLGRQQQWLLQQQKQQQQQQYSSWTMAAAPANYRIDQTQSSSQVYMQPPFNHYPPAADNGIVSQGSANSFMATGTGLFTPGPHITDNPPQ